MVFNDVLFFNFRHSFFEESVKDSAHVDSDQEWEDKDERPAELVLEFYVRDKPSKKKDTVAY